MKDTTMTAVELSRFMGRVDNFAIQLKTGAYAPMNRKITIKDLQDHLDGVYTYGTYVIKENGNISFVVVDIDGDPKDNMKIWLAVAEQAMVVFSDFDRCLEFSGRRGYHIWIFLKEEEKPAFFRELVKSRLKLKGLRNIEVYPKQDKLDGLKKELGNLVKLPCGIHLKSGKRSKILEWRMKK